MPDPLPPPWNRLPPSEYEDEVERTGTVRRERHAAPFGALVLIAVVLAAAAAAWW